MRSSRRKLGLLVINATILLAKKTLEIVAARMAAHPGNPAATSRAISLSIRARRFTMFRVRISIMKRKSILTKVNDGFTLKQKPRQMGGERQ